MRLWRVRVRYMTKVGDHYYASVLLQAENVSAAMDEAAWVAETRAELGADVVEIMPLSGSVVELPVVRHEARNIRRTRTRLPSSAPPQRTEDI